MNSGKTTLEIDLSAIAANYRIFQSLGNAVVAAVVKADCYGLGAKQIVPLLNKIGCKNFFTANCDEGISIKSLAPNTNIYILSGVFRETCKDLEANGLVPVLNNLDQLLLWQEQAKNCNKKLSCVLHIDTGMNRLGMAESDLIKFRQEFDSNWLDLHFVMSHLASAELKDHHENVTQLKRFLRATSCFADNKKSLSNSSGAFLGDKYHFDLIRPGAGLYGINPTPYIPSSPINHVVKLLAPIIHIQKVKQGVGVGYNGLFKATRDSIIATLPIGYADGLPISLGGNGFVFINNKPAPIIGRVSMDLITIDVTDIPSGEIFLGEQVEIIGPNCNIDKLASLSETISYEILTKLGTRFERVYK